MMHRGGAFVLALTLLCSGCDAIIGNEYAVSRACGGFVDVAAGCATCGSEQCCAEGSACRASPKCAALYDCLVTCERGDAPCQAA